MNLVNNASLNLPTPSNQVYLLQQPTLPVNEEFYQATLGNIGSTDQIGVGNCKKDAKFKPKRLKKINGRYSGSDYKNNDTLKKMQNNSILKTNARDDCINKGSGQIYISTQNITVIESSQNQIGNNDHKDGSFNDNSNNSNQEIEVFNEECNVKNVDFVENKGREEVVKSPSSFQFGNNSFPKPKVNVIWKGKNKYFCCALCSKPFCRMSKLRLHENSKCGSLKLFNCNICAKGFTTSSYLNSHISHVHHTSENNSPIKCHIKTKHKEKEFVPHTCEYCQKGYLSIDSLKRHIKFKHHSGSEYFQNNSSLKINAYDNIRGSKQICIETVSDGDHCTDGDLNDNSNDSNIEIGVLKGNYSFQNLDSVTNHNSEEAIKASSSLLSKSNSFPKVNIIWKGNKKYFCCTLCSKPYSRMSKLKVHEKSKCGSLKLFNCKICAKGFTTTTSLNSHISHVHTSENNSKFKCDHCECSFAYPNSLIIHKKTKHKEKEFVRQTCEYCQKGYLSLGSLKRHIKFKHHSGSEYFECAHCSKQFSQKNLLKHHIKVTHLPDIIKCPLCKRCYSTQENLQIHLKMRHSEERKLVCDVCGKQFRTILVLENHLRTHSGEKPFMCQTCGKCFTTDSNLVQHSVIHSERRPFVCDQCSMSFRIRNHLRQHMAVHGLNNTSITFRKRRKK